MAIELKYLTPIVLIVLINVYQSYCADLQSSTTPWPELGSRRRVQAGPVTPAPKRDFVSQPSAWNKPLVESSPTPTTPRRIQSASIPEQKPLRDFVSSPRPSTNLNSNLNPTKTTTATQNPNIKFSYAGAANPNNRPQPQSPPRDYVNPNIQLSYSNIVGYNNKNTLNNNNNAKPIAQTSSTTASSPGSPNQNQGNQAATATERNPDNPQDRTSEDNELREFSEALIRKDSNNAFKYVKVNYQGKTRSSSFKDEAPELLLSIESAAYKIPSIEKLMLLYNNYLLHSNENEVYTAQEKIEENNFLDTILSTPVMQHTRNFLVSKGKLSKDPKDFKDILRTIWFNMYSRGGGKIGSSGFEHVFLSEIKNDAISGLHNWLYFNEEEKKNVANYLGYMKKLEFEKGAILKYHFNFHQTDKPVGSMFIGTSPEFELALYSTCFLVRPDDVCPLRLGGKNFVIRTYTYRYRGKKLIGSAFPEI